MSGYEHDRGGRSYDGGARDRRGQSVLNRMWGMGCLE